MSAVARARIQEPSPEDAAAQLEHARSHWTRLVSRFLDMGEPLQDAMVAAARIVAFGRTGPLSLDGNQETRRSTPPPASGIRRRVR